MEKLQNLKVSSTFVLHLKNNFQALADLEDYMQSDKKDVNVKWEQGKTAYCKIPKISPSKYKPPKPVTQKNPL